MKHEVYVSFLKKMTVIWNDCVVQNEIAEKDPERYTIYQMKTPANHKIKIAYDNEKLKKHVETLRGICEEVPQVQLGPHTYVIPVGQLNDENLKKISDPKERAKKAHQCANLSEFFLSTCTTTGIMYGIDQDPEKLTTIYGMMKERIRSRYQEGEEK